MTKRWMILLLSAVLCISSIPITAAAETVQETNSTEVVEEAEKMPDVTEYDDVLDMEIHEVCREDIQQEIYDAEELIAEAESMPSFMAEIYDSSWDTYSNYFVYNRLSPEGQKLWDGLQILFTRYLETDEDIEYATTEFVEVETTESHDEEIGLLLRIFRYSNPQYYYLMSTAYYWADETSMGLGFGVYDAFADGDDRMAATRQVQKQLDEWYTQINACANKEEKVLKIHDLVCSKVEYNHYAVDTGILVVEQQEFTQSAYSVLCMDRAVCAGYALTYAMLCNGAGIECFGVTSPGHAWNKVKVNDSWYNVDCTWDDVPNGGIMYHCFIRNDAYYDTLGSHTPEADWNGFLPLCTRDSESTHAAPGMIPRELGHTAPVQIRITEGETSYKVSMSTTTKDALIYYTLDGRDPSESATKGHLYRGEFEINETALIRAIAVRDCLYDSTITEGGSIEELTYPIATGECGENAIWSLDNQGTLTLYGFGRMMDCVGYGESPWKDYKKQIQRVEIRDGITGVGAYAFTNLPQLKFVSVPSSVEKIGNYAFYYSDLQAIEFSEGLQEIGEYAFKQCYELQSVSLPKTLTKLGKDAFYSAGLINLKISGPLDEVGKNAFSYCDKLEQVELDDSVKRLGEFMFSQCAALKNIVLPKNLEVIEWSAFRDSGLEEVTVPGNLKEWEGGFAACGNLKRVIIEEGIVTIPLWAFSHCISLEYVEIPESVTTIDYVFEDCPSLKQIVIPETVTQIHEEAFESGITIIGYGGSAAHEYALTYEYTFVDINDIGLSVQFITSSEQIIPERYYLEGWKIKEPEVEDRPGYEMAGWYTSAELQDETTMWNFEKDVIAGNMKLYAKWIPNQYMVSFNANYEDAQTPESIRVQYGSPYGELPQVSREGYQFAGWYRSDAENILITAESIYDVPDDVILVALWRPKLYVITLNAEGGLADPGYVEVAYETAYGSLPVPVYEGYRFEGWYTEDGKLIGEDTVLESASDQTLYAHWTPNVYRITFNTDNGEEFEMQEVTFGEMYGQLPTLERTGYEFCGWKLEDGTVILEDTLVDTAADHVLYAQWTANQYSILLEKNGGIADTDALSVTFGEAYGELPVPVKEGHSFLGWYTKEGVLITEESIVDTDADHTLYASYTANTCTVSFETNGGDTEVTGVSRLYGEVYGELPQPSMPGMVFVGWFTENGAEITAESIVETSADHTLYARWDYKYTTSAPEANIPDGSEVEKGTRLSLVSETNGASIYYTTDPEIGESVSAENGILYEDVIFLTEDVTIYAVAVKDGHKPSQVQRFSYTVADDSLDWGDITEEDRGERGFETALDVPEGLWLAGVSDREYTGKAHTFTDLHIYNNKTLLQENNDYTVKYTNNTNAGTATITVTGKGNYAGTIVETFAILPLDLSEASVADVKVPYTGKVQKVTSAVTFMLDDKEITLKSGKDYTVTYPGTDSKAPDYNSDAFKQIGTYEVVLTGKGNYTGTTTYTQVIDGKYAMSKMSVAKIPDQKYTGEAFMPSLVIKNGKTALVEGVDYTAEYTNNTQVGTATVTITGMGEYAGVKTVTFKITGTALSKAKMSGFVASMPWTGEELVQDVRFSYTTGSGANKVTNELSEGVDYTVTYTNNTEVGTATVVYTGMGGYTGTIKKTYKITGLAMSKAVVSGLEKSVDFVPGEIRQNAYALTYAVKVDGVTENVPLIEGTDYEVSYKNNTKAGNASIVFKGIGGYTGSLTKSFTIKAMDMTKAEGKIVVSEIEEQAYRKGGVMPQPVVKYVDGETEVVLEAGKDYTLKYSNNKTVADKAAKKAPLVTITGKGSYKGTLKQNFTIVASDLSVVTISAKNVVYQNKAGICKPTITLKDVDGKTLSAGTDYDKNISYTYAKDTKVGQMVKKKLVYVVREQGAEVDKLDIIPVGAEIIATVNGKNLYEGSKSVRFRFIASDISKASVKIAAQEYTGKAVEPTKNDLTVTIGKTVLAKTDYVIVGYENNVKKGTAKMTIRGIGNYGGEKTVTFPIASKTMNYTIIFDKNALGVTGTMKNTALSSGKKLTANVYKRSGYVFAGWNTKADGSGVSYSDKEAFYLKGQKVYGTRVRLYAQWVEK